MLSIGIDVGKVPRRDLDITGPLASGSPQLAHCDASPGRHRSKGVSFRVAGPAPGWRSDAGGRFALTFEKGSRMSCQFTVGLSAKGKADRIVVLPKMRSLQG
jgi:hypothetical protein